MNIRLYQGAAVIFGAVAIWTVAALVIDALPKCSNTETFVLVEPNPAPGETPKSFGPYTAQDLGCPKPDDQVTIAVVNGIPVIQKNGKPVVLPSHDDLPQGRWKGYTYEISADSLTPRQIRHRNQYLTLVISVFIFIASLVLGRRARQKSYLKQM